MAKKLSKRKRRKQSHLLQQESSLDLYFSDFPTRFLCVGNGGMSNGITPALMKRLLHCGTAFQLYMPRKSSVAFVEFPSVTACQEVLLSLDGVCVQNCIEKLGIRHLVAPAFLAGPPIHLYIFFVATLPSEVVQPKLSISSAVGRGGNYSLPQGLTLLYEFISVGEEFSLLDYFLPADESRLMHATKFGGSSAVEMIGSVHHLEFKSTQRNPPENYQTGDLHSFDVQSLSVVDPDDKQSQFIGDQSCIDDGMSAVCSNDCSKTLKLRSVKHFGYEFLYGRNTVDISHPLPGGIPALCTPLLKRIASSQLVDHSPDQLTVNIYKPGAGIPPHVDTHSAFQDGIISLSLGSQVIMQFSHSDGRKTDLLLPPRSLLVMKGESRYVWTHSIPARKSDAVERCDPGVQSLLKQENAVDVDSLVSDDTGSGVLVLPRGVRVSLTLRKTLCEPCHCGFNEHCDWPAM